MGAIGKYYIKDNKVEDVKIFKENEGKIVYEVIRITKGKPLFYERHYNRMLNSLKLNKCDYSITSEELKKLIKELTTKNKITTGNIKITYNMDSKELKLFVIKHKYPTLKMYSEGVPTILYFGERENPNAKVINNSFRGKVNEVIEKREVFEAILVNNEGYITEGSKSNIFLIKDNKLYTSKVETVLPGVTRTEIIEMAKENDIEVIETNIKYLDLPQYEAMFISGTSPHILPINKVEEQEYDTKNELLRKLMNLFNKRVSNYIGK